MSTTNDQLASTDLDHVTGGCCAPCAPPCCAPPDRCCEPAPGYGPRGAYGGYGGYGRWGREERRWDQGRWGYRR